MQHILRKAFSKPGWAVRKAYLWGRSIAGLRSDDVVFAFYPKTGSTWVRIFLYNLLAAKENMAADALSFDAVDDTMPEFANPSFFIPWPFKSAPRVIKTHRPYLRFWNGRKTVLFTREPRDTMVSFLHYANAKKEFAFSGGLDDLLRHPEMGLDAYFGFYSSWLPQAGLVVTYEDLRGKPAETFRRILDFVGIAATDAEIAAAMDASSLEKTRKAQEQSSDRFKRKFAEGFVFARKGAVGEGRTQFTAAQEAYYQELRQHWRFPLYD